MRNQCWESIPQMPSKIITLNTIIDVMKNFLQLVIHNSQDFDHWILNIKSEYDEDVNYACDEICKWI